MAAIDNFVSGRGRDALRSASHWALVTPDDSNDLTYVSRFVCFAAAGTIKVTTVGGETLVIPSGTLAAGIMHSVEWTRIWSTSTTVTGIVYGY